MNYVWQEYAPWYVFQELSLTQSNKRFSVRHSSSRQSPRPKRLGCFKWILKGVTKYILLYIIFVEKELDWVTKYYIHNALIPYFLTEESSYQHDIGPGTREEPVFNHMMPNKSLGRIKVFCNFEIWIFLVWIIPQQSSVSPPSKALVYRPTSLLWSLIGQMVTFTNAWPWVRSRVESYLTTPKAFAILAETSTVPGTETWVSTEKHSLLVKRIEAGCLCVMGENTQQLPRNSQERRLRGARSVLPSSIRQQPSWPFHNYHFSSKEKKDGGAMHLGGGGENASSLVRGLCLQDSQRSHGSCAL